MRHSDWRPDGASPQTNSMGNFMKSRNEVDHYLFELVAGESVSMEVNTSREPITAAVRAISPLYGFPCLFSTALDLPS